MGTTSEKNRESGSGLGSVREAVAEGNANFAAAMARKDAAGVAACYTEDAEFMAGGGPAFKGRANIEKALAGYIAQGFTKYAVATFTVYNDAGVVGVQTIYNLSQADGSQLDNGKSIQLWKQEMGAWKIFRDCFNSNLSGS